MIHRGYVYESVDAEAEQAYQNFINGGRIDLRYQNYIASRLSASNEPPSEDEYLDFEDELETNKELSPEDIAKKWNLSFKKVGGDLVYEEISRSRNHNSYYIVRGREQFKVDDIIDDPESYYASFPEYSTIPAKLNEEFWKWPETLYHATQEEYVEPIMKEGLLTRWGSGMTNRGTRGVFTSESPDGYIDSYGDYKIRIDTDAMKRDGFTPDVQREPEVLSHIVSQAINHTYDIPVEREPEHSGGMDPQTWIVTEGIPPKYLSLLES